MDQKERLIKLLEEAEKKCNDTKQCENCVGFGHGCECVNHLIAEHLLSNGVVATDMDVVSAENRPLISQCLGHPLDEIIDLIRAKEEGRIIVPPCKLGQTFYKVGNGEILEVKVVSIHYEPLPAFTYTIRFDNSLGSLCLMSDGTRNEAYSWDIYATKEEAEAKLAERESK